MTNDEKARAANEIIMDRRQAIQTKAERLDQLMNEAEWYMKSIEREVRDARDAKDWLREHAPEQADKVDIEFFIGTISGGTISSGARRMLIEKLHPNGGK